MQIEKIYRKNLQNQILNKDNLWRVKEKKTLIMKWHYKKEVFLLSKINNQENAQTAKQDKIGYFIIKPKLVVDYNKHMGRFSTLDQYLHDFKKSKKHEKMLKK